MIEGELQVIPMFQYFASPVKSLLHKKGGGSREGNDTFISNTNCQEIEN